MDLSKKILIFLLLALPVAGQPLYPAPNGPNAPVVGVILGSVVTAIQKLTFEQLDTLVAEFWESLTSVEQDAIIARMKILDPSRN